MIVFVGDWVKAQGQWGQVVEVDAGNEMFAMLDHNGLQTWWVTSIPEVYEDHVSNLRMQDKLRNAGL